jgi:hypothetical protein
MPELAGITPCARLGRAPCAAPSEPVSCPRGPWPPYASPPSPAESLDRQRGEVNPVLAREWSPWPGDPDPSGTPGVVRGGGGALT